MRRVTLRRAFIITILIGLASVLAARGQSPTGSTPGSCDVSEPKTFSQCPDFVEIRKLYLAGQHESVVKKVDQFTSIYTLSPVTVPVLLYKAESQCHLGRLDEAIRGYQLAILFIQQLNNVQQRQFSTTFFRLGVLYREHRDLGAAVQSVEAALRLESQKTYYQIFLGELFREQSQPERALKHFKEVAASSLSSNEERAVLAMKIDRLASGKLGASVAPPDMRDAPLYPDISIGIMALNQLPSTISLPDVCVVLESKWLVRCEVLEGLQIPDTDILTAERDQYDGARVLDVLGKRFPVSSRRHRFVVAVTGRDIFGPGTREAGTGTGVISAYRFATGVADFYEKDSILTRRLAIQAISTTASMLGFTRPTNPECPDAYPHGGTPGVFGEARSTAVARVYKAYYLD